MIKNSSNNCMINQNQDILSNILFELKNPKLTLVCSLWQKITTDRVYGMILSSYSKQEYISRFCIPISSQEFSFSNVEKLEKTFRTVNIYFFSSDECLEEKYRYRRANILDLNPIAKVVYNLAMVSFFSDTCQTIIKAKTLKINKKLNSKVVYIKKWMTNNKSEFENITELRLNYVYPIIPDEIAILSNLQKLTLANNRWPFLSLNLNILPNLTFLNLSGNHLSSNPSGINTLVNLTELDFSNNKLTTLTSELGSLTNLKHLELRNNKFTIFPDAICTLRKLTFLNFTYNKITTFSEDISSLVKLTYLNFSHNKLKEIPSGIGGLTNLLRLEIKNNRLSSLPVEFGNLNNLTILHLSFNQFKSLPKEINQLISLTKLFPNYNSIADIGDISQLTRLQRLYLTHNLLSKLPSSIGKLKI